MTNFTNFRRVTKRLFMGVAFLFSFTFSFSQSVSSYWKFLNPSPIGVHITDLDYVNDEVGYASCEAGVIGRTTDGGHTWTYDYISTREALWAIQFPNETTGYAVGSGGRIVKTTNRGITWAAITSPTTAQLNNLFFWDASTGIVVGNVSGGSATIFKTTNGGATWTSLAAGFPVQNRDIRAISFLDAAIGYASGAAGLVAKTNDGGITWTNISLVAGNPAAVNSGNAIVQNYPGLGVVDAQTVIISSQNNTFVIKTSNGGLNWTIKVAQSGTPVTIPGSVQMLNIAVKDSRVAIAMASSLVGVSFDKGDTWNVSRVFAPTNINSRLQFAAIEITPGNHVKVGGLYGTMADSLSGSARWDTSYYKNVNYSPFVQKQVLSVSHLDKNNILVSGVNGHIYKSIDGGVTWRDKTIPEFTPPLMTPVAINDIKFVAADATFMACSNGYVYWSTDGAETWPNPNAFFTGRNNLGLDFLDKNIGWVCGSSGAAGSGVVYRTTNGGTTWTAQAGSPFTGLTNMLGIDFINSTTGWVVGGPAKIFKTTDGGVNWTAQTPPASVTGILYSVSFANADTGYAAGASGKVIRTINGGTNWTDITPSGLTGIVNKIVFINGTTGALFGTGGNCYKTTDAGATWTIFNPPTTDAFFSASVSAPYNSVSNIASGTDVEMLVVGGRLLGGLSPTIMHVRLFSAAAIPILPVIINVTDQCVGAGSAKGKIMNPPPYTQIDITVDGVPVLYYPNDSSFVYYESGVTTAGNHTVRVRYTTPGGSVFRDVSFNYYAVNLIPLVAITSNDADNVICEGQAVTFTATPVNCGTTPSYQWKVNGVITGTNSNTYSYVPSNRDVVSVQVTSSFACVTNPHVMTFTQPLDVVQFNPEITAAATNLIRVTSPVNGAAYQWYRDGQPISGATGTSYKTSLFGNYAVQETYRTCSKMSNIITLSPKAGTANDLIIYPVPASRIVYAQTGSATTQINRVTIYDAGGKQLLTRNFTNGNIVEIDIVRLPVGLYFARFETSSAVITKKFIKQ